MPIFPDSAQIKKSANGASKYSMGFKIIIRSAGSGGATSLLFRQCNKTFNQYPTATIGAEFQPKDLQVSGHKFQIQFWDIAGFNAGNLALENLISKHYQSCDAYIICLDLTNRGEFEKIRAQLSGMRDHLTETDNENMAIFLMANKADETAKCLYNDEHIKHFANEIGAKAHFTCSAKTGQGVSDAFQIVYNHLLATHASHLVNVTSPYSPKISAPQQPPLANLGSLASQSIVASAPPRGNPPPYTVKPGPDEQSSWYAPQ